jgi:hypothetical protein
MGVACVWEFENYRALFLGADEKPRAEERYDVAQGVEHREDGVVVG